MHNKGRFPNAMFGASLRPESAVVAIMLLLLFLMFLFLFVTLTAQPAQAQTFQVIYSFTGEADGGMPSGGGVLDSAGNLYGTTSNGGYMGGSCGLSQQFPGCGTVYKLSHQGSGWTLSSLYSFTGVPDGSGSVARVVVGPDDSLYGTTTNGGKVFPQQSTGCGTVFSLRSLASKLSPATETVLYRFAAGADGSYPMRGDLVFDPAGVMYGTTDGGGCAGDGGSTTVYELVPSQGGWNKSTLHRFTGGTDGSCIWGGVILDGAGNVYGMTCFGGNPNGVCGSLGCGTVFQLTRSGSGWTKNVLYSFQGGSDGAYPYGGLIWDEAGNLYGTTLMYGSGFGGTVFMLSPSNGNWTFTLLYSFTTAGNPGASLLRDGAGNLYGTTSSGGAHGYGNVFKLTRSNGGYTYSSLHDFSGAGDGGNGYNNSSNLALDANGDLYGTAMFGGNGACGGFGCGTVWEITP